MRYRLMAMYRGAPYQAGFGPEGTEVTLFAACPPPEELGFSSAAGHWRKQVDVTDLDALWQSRPIGDYRGDPCLVLDDLGDRLHIVYLGRDAVLARQLGYWEVDREVFEVVVPRHEVTDLTEERTEVPLSAATFPPPRAAARPYPGAYPDLPVAARAPARAQSEGYPPAPPAIPDRAAAWHGSPASDSWPEPRPASGAWAAREPWEASDPREPAEGPEGTSRSAPPGRRNGREDRASSLSVFAELLDLAAIPQAAYAVNEEVSGAMCVIKTDGGFEVFSRTDDARLEVRSFEDEEAAYFYLFGVLAAEAIRSGRLRPYGYGNGSRGPGAPSAQMGNVSKYLRSGK
jgi:hypothetical protein